MIDTFFLSRTILLDQTKWKTIIKMELLLFIFRSPPSSIFRTLLLLMFQTRSDANKMCVTQGPFDISQSFIRSQTNEGFLKICWLHTHDIV
jgi:hypothetical protein